MRTFIRRGMTNLHSFRAGLEEPKNPESSVGIIIKDYEICLCLAMDTKVGLNLNSK